MPGLLALVGGAELTSGNEPQDRRMVTAAGAAAGRAFVVSTAAARRGRLQAVENARRWFGALGLDLEELPLLTRSAASDPRLVERARSARFLYLTGGDPGLVPHVLRGSDAWSAMVDAWRRGAVLGGSSAGAMGLCEHVLLRASWPDRRRRRASPGLGLLPGCAVIPHFDTFGRGWVPFAGDALPGVTLLGLDERTAIVWDGTAWGVMGPGSVTIIVRGEVMDVHRAGDAVSGLPSP